MENICAVAKICGGCQLQGKSYEEQLKTKFAQEVKLLGGFGTVNPVLGMKDPTHYRNKVQCAFGKDEKGHIISGNYVESTHAIVPVDDCMISNETANKIIVSVRRLAIKYHISAFDEHAMKGCLRHCLVRTATTGEVLVALVTGSVTIPHQKEFLTDLLKYNPEITTVVQSINNRHTSMVLGEKVQVLYGPGFIVDKLCGLKFKISAQSFYQVNSRQTEVLYNTAIEMADFKGTETIIDAYCGIGTIGLIASKKVKKVIGVELNKTAIKDAMTNMKMNHISNASFIADDAGRFMNQFTKTNKERIDAVIMDPPRAGSDEKFMSSVIRLNPQKVIYVSCNPVTLKENLFYFTRHGYAVKKIQPVDMFPFTTHVETVVLMSKKDIKQA